MASAITFKKNFQPGSDIRFVFAGADLLPRYSHTAMWKARYVADAGYGALAAHSHTDQTWHSGSLDQYLTCTHPCDGTFEDSSGQRSNAGADPVGTQHFHEIAGLANHDYIASPGPGTPTELVTDVWLSQARVCELISGGTVVRHRYYPDLSDPSNFIQQDVALAGFDGGVLQFAFGAHAWTGSAGANSECPACDLRGIQLYDEPLDIGQIMDRIDLLTDAAVTAADPGSLFYCNLNPTPDDVSDKSGVGHDPVYATDERPGLWEDSVSEEYELKVAVVLDDQAGTITGRINGVPANSLVVAFVCYGEDVDADPHCTGVEGIVDGDVSGQDFTRAGSKCRDEINNQGSEVWYLENCVGGDIDFTATLDTARSYRRFIALVYTGIELSGAFDGATQVWQASPGTGTDGISSGSITPTNTLTADLIVAFTQDTSGLEAAVAGSGFTVRHSAVEFSAEDGVWTSGSIAGTFTQSANDSRTTHVAAFKIAAGGAGGQTITPSGLASAEAFGTAKLNGKIAPAGIASAGAFGTTKINPRITATGIATAQAFGTTVVHPGAVTIAPSGIASAQAFGTAAVVPAAVTISPSGIASAEAFGSAKINPKITAAGIATAEAFGTTKINPRITASGIASAESFGTPLLGSGGTGINPQGIASAETFGGATIAGGAVTITAAGIASLEAFGTSKINQRIAPTGIASLQAFGTTKLNPRITVNGIASAEGFGAAVLLPGAVTIQTTGIASGQAFGSDVISSGDATIVGVGIASAEAFGSAKLTVKITMAGIASLEAFGTAELLTGTRIRPTGIASAEGFGAATVAAGAAIIQPGGIASLAAFGVPTISQRVSGTGIASGEAFGVGELVQGTASVRPSGIASAAAFGHATISLEIIIDPDNPVAAAFLDRFERFAKSEGEITTVRVFYGGTVFEDMTYAAFRRLPRARQDLIKNTGSAAGRIDTNGKSNA